jgi:hypothetical protein
LRSYSIDGIESSVDVVLKYRGRGVTSTEVEHITRLIDDNPKMSRRRLSFKLCAEWNWTQANGHPRDVVCRGMLLALDRGGHIRLPAPRCIFKQPPRRKKSTSMEIEETPLVAPLAEIGEVEIRQVRRTAEEGLVESLIERHHYLGYTRVVGEHLKYLVTAHDLPIGCFCWSSAPRHLGPRDRFIGWSPQARKANIHFVAYQSRFLILPWVRVPHLASHLLGRMSRQLSSDWVRVYAHPIYFAETFVDPDLYRGTCYRASNWTYMGMTTGRGKDDQTKRANRSLKQVYGYPLIKDFRKYLGVPHE